MKNHKTPTLPSEHGSWKNIISQFTWREKAQIDWKGDYGGRGYNQFRYSFVVLYFWIILQKRKYLGREEWLIKCAHKRLSISYYRRRRNNNIENWIKWCKKLFLKMITMMIVSLLWSSTSGRQASSMKILKSVELWQSMSSFK